MNSEIHRERGETSRYTPSLEEAKALAEDGAVVSVYESLSASFETPSAALLKLTEKNLPGTPSVLLESVEHGTSLGRYSLIIPCPGRTIEVSSKAGWTEKKGGKTVIHEQDRLSDPLKILSSLLPRKTAKAPGLPPFRCGFVGYLGYENIHRWEPSVPIHKDTAGVEIPDAVLLEIKDLVVFDHVTREMKIISNIYPENSSDVNSDYQEAVERIKNMKEKLLKSLDLKKYIRREALPRYESTSNFTQEEYEATVEKARKLIEQGDCLQIVTSQRFQRRTEAKPFDIYRALCQTNPSPFQFYMDFGGFQLVGASPELLVRVENGKVTTWPIAGTRPRGKTPEEDEALAKELIEDEKERAEHTMLVDLGRNDIGRISKIGTVKVPRLMEVEFFSTVIHMTSEVTGELEEGLTSLDAIRSVFPAGTVTGAPKVRAMQRINELETERRGPYSGLAGVVSGFNNAELAITIRTMLVKDGMVYNQAGGGVVYDSKPYNEYQETRSKALGGQRAVNLAEEAENY